MKIIHFHLIALSLGICACTSVGPDYKLTTPTVPDYWNTNLHKDLRRGTPSIEGWWRRFHDPTLNRLIRIGKVDSQDLRIAAERIIEVRARYGITRSKLAPTVAGSSEVSRSRASESLPFASPNPSDHYSMAINSSWEIDFFGGLRRSMESAAATVEAKHEVYHDTMVILYSDIAESYVNYRTLQRRIQFAKNNISSQRDTVKLTKELKVAGITAQTDVFQAETNLATSQALVPKLEGQLATTRNKIAVLIGRYPHDMNRLLGSSTKIPRPPRIMSIGIPADMLRARPDIRAAERELAAQTAQIGVAKSELYPKFFIKGKLGLQSGSRANLFDAKSRIYSLGPSFQWRVFEAGGIRQSVNVEKSKTRQALINYEKVVLGAVAEVETSLSLIKFEARRRNFLNQSVTSARKAVSLIKGNYKDGVVDFQNVLDAERTIFQNQDAAAASEGIYTINHIKLYRALGGGTKMRPVTINKNK